MHRGLLTRYLAVISFYSSQLNCSVLTNYISIIEPTNWSLVSVCVSFNPWGMDEEGGKGKNFKAVGRYMNSPEVPTDFLHTLIDLTLRKVSGLHWVSLEASLGNYVLKCIKNHMCMYIYACIYIYPWRRKCNLLQYSSLENPMDGGSC